MKRPYLLSKRGKVWYYKLPHETTYHSTGQTSRVSAERHVQAFVRKPESTNVSLRDFTTDFFIWEKCSWIQRQHARHHPFSRAVAAGRRAHLDNHILPRWGKYPIAGINQVEVERWLVGLELAAQTKNQILTTFRIVMRDARRQGIIASDPLADVERMGSDTRPRDAFSMAELRLLFPTDDDRRLLQIWGDMRYAAAFAVLASTGIRSGELRALEWQDVYWNPGILHITKAVKADNTIGALKMRENDPANSERVAILPSWTTTILRQWFEQTPYNQPVDYIVYGRYRGQPIDRRTLSGHLGHVLPRAGIVPRGRNLVAHSFRHTFNTMMRNVLSAEILRALTGHKTEEMTELYYHPTLEDRLKQVRLSESQKLIENVWVAQLKSEPQSEDLSR